MHFQLIFTQEIIFCPLVVTYVYSPDIVYFKTRYAITPIDSKKKNLALEIHMYTAVMCNNSLFCGRVVLRYWQTKVGAKFREKIDDKKRTVHFKIISIFERTRNAPDKTVQRESGLFHRQTSPRKVDKNIRPGRKTDRFFDSGPVNCSFIQSITVKAD